ncbi:MAG TPA: membrane protein insertase YidC, partial [Bryobacteraceae bacterium]|nr:membrane protein insertase YidC [Bryobacteraceae bacterium]
MQRNLLLAVVLTGVVFFSSQFLIKQPDPRETVKPVQSASPQQAKKPEITPETPPAPTDATQIIGQKEETYNIETNLYKLVLSNRGGVVRSWQLKQYTDGTGKPLELVNGGAAAKVQHAFAYVFESQKPSVDLNTVLFAGKPTGDGLGIDFEYSNGRTTARKSLRFQRDSYLSQVTSEVRENRNGVPHLLSWRGGFGDRTVQAAAAQQRTFYFDLSTNKLVENEVKVAKEGPSTVSGNYSFAGIEDTYFAGVFLPKEQRPIKLQTISDQVAIREGSGEEPVIGAAVGGDFRNEFSFFVGPKDLDLLAKVDPKLRQAVDFGWAGFIAKPLFSMLNWLNDRYLHNFGWSIIVATILINLIFIPLKISGLSSMRKMALLKPEMDEINRRHKNAGFNDPKKQAEVME